MHDHIVVVEDDPPQTQTIKEDIEQSFPQLKVDVLETESDFYSALSDMDEQHKPCLVICDTMLPWYHPNPDNPDPPAEVKEEGAWRKAGIRCWKEFRKIRHLHGVPWIYYTVLDEKAIDFRTNSDRATSYVQKTNSSEPLLRQLRLCLKTRDGPGTTGGETTVHTTHLGRMMGALLRRLRAVAQDQG
jgi:DNA-binding NarL/FixJ family response regulator